MHILFYDFLSGSSIALKLLSSVCGHFPFKNEPIAILHDNTPLRLHLPVLSIGKVVLTGGLVTNVLLSPFR